MSDTVGDMLEASLEKRHRTAVLSSEAPNWDGVTLSGVTVHEVQHVFAELARLRAIETAARLALPELDWREWNETYDENTCRSCESFLGSGTEGHKHAADCSYVSTVAALRAALSPGSPEGT